MVDDSNGIGGDKIKALLMVGMKAKTLVWLMVVAVMTMRQLKTPRKTRLQKAH